MRNRSNDTPVGRIRALSRGAAWPLSLLLACPTAAWAGAARPDFELIRYRLPETAVSARISLTLESCDSDPVVSGELAIVAEADGSEAEFPLTTGRLKSNFIKRELKLSLHDTGAIATLGSANENRVGAIVGDAIKFVAQVAGAFVHGGAPLAMPSKALPPPPLGSACSPEALEALARVKAIDDRLAAWRTAPAPADPVAASAQSRAIDRLATERAALRVGLLHADLVAPLDLGDLPKTTPAYMVTTTPRMDGRRVPWLAKEPAADAVKVAWTVNPPEGGAFPAQTATTACRSALAPGAKDKKGKLGICLPRPVYAKVQAQLISSWISSGGGATSSLKAAKTLPFPQWGDVQFLDLTAKGDRVVNLSLDKFGRTSEASWTAKARAETIAAGLAGAAEQAAAFAAANSSSARQKAEIDALTTQQTLNRLRACREILAAGGSACPAEASVGGQSPDGGN